MLILFSIYAGMIESIGDDVQGFRVGDEVFAVNSFKHVDVSHPDKTSGGAFAEYILLPYTRLSHKPAMVTHDDQAASVALSGITVYESHSVVKGYVV